MLCQGFQILTDALLLVAVYSLDTDTSLGKKASVPRLTCSFDVVLMSTSTAFHIAGVESTALCCRQYPCECAKDIACKWWPGLDELC